MVQSSRERTANEGSTPTPRVRAYWYTAAEAAHVLRISEPAVRRRIAGGSLTAVRAGRSWRVLLPGDPTPPVAEAAAQPERETSTKSAEPAVESMEPLIGLVRDLQRQSLALAGQIGYLQNELTRTQGQLESLRDEARAQVTAAPESPQVDPASHQAALDEIDRLRDQLAARNIAAAPSPGRRGWKFWRKQKT